MGEDDYLSSRVDDQIGWYDKKSQSAQRWFKGLRGTEIISAAAIPIISGFATDPVPVTLLVGLLGALIAIISSFISLNQLQEKWIEYRTTCESLKHEKYLFMTKAEPYNQDEPFPLFVKRVESLISKENSSWNNYTNSSLEGIGQSPAGKE